MPTRLLAALPALALAATLAPAQVPPSGVAPGGGPLQRPGISPYLNLVRPGNPGVNYAGLVRPQQQFAANQGQLQGQLNGVYADVNQLQNRGPYSGAGSELTTGVGFGFQTHRRYFLTAGAGGSGGFGTVGRGGAGAGAVRAGGVRR